MAVWSADLTEKLEECRAWNAEWSDRLDALYSQFLYAQGASTWGLRISLNECLLSKEWHILTASGAVTQEDADRMQERQMTRIRRYYDRMKNLKDEDIKLYMDGRGYHPPVEDPDI